MEPSSSPEKNPQEAAELRAVLGSRSFSSAPTLSNLLSFLGDHYLSDSKDSLNEYRIAVDALRRPESFDPSNNSSVRVEMHRLRTKLRRFYETEGADHPLRIQIDSGDYRLQFVARDGSEAPSTSAPEGARLEPALPGESSAGAQAGEAISPWRSLIRSRFPWRSKRLAVIAFAVLMLGIAIVWFSVRKYSHAGFSPATNMPSPLASASLTPAAIEDGSVRILAGSTRKHLDRDGRVWEADRYFSGGHSIDLDFPYIQGTADETVYRSARYGTFSYDIPVRSGSYELRLHFVETAYGPGTTVPNGVGKRTFSVFLGDQPLVQDLDVFSAIGGNYRAYTRVFTGISAAKDGMVHLRFIGGEDMPFTNAIELIPASGNRLNPVRLVMQAAPYRDAAGQQWASDEYAFGGELVTHLKTPEGVTDGRFYAGERYGHFDYQIPVAPGKYAVKLYFIEAYFGTFVPKDDSGGRLFDLYANGQILLHNFDILKEAGGPYRVVTETFHGIEPNAAGLIDLSFIPTRNYATVDAIEVTDETQ